MNFRNIFFILGIIFFGNLYCVLENFNFKNWWNTNKNYIVGDDFDEDGVKYSKMFNKIKNSTKFAPNKLSKQIVDGACGLLEKILNGMYETKYVNETIIEGFSLCEENDKKDNYVYCNCSGFVCALIKKYSQVHYKSIMESIEGTLWEDSIKARDLYPKKNKYGKWDSCKRPQVIDMYNAFKKQKEYWELIKNINNILPGDIISKTTTKKIEPLGNTGHVVIALSVPKFVKDWEKNGQKYKIYELVIIDSSTVNDEPCSRVLTSPNFSGVGVRYISLLANENGETINFFRKADPSAPAKTTVLNISRPIEV
ncbi:hypothetical protein KJ644_00395 [Candidatus Dependentiae bacterium]|nr:hypothetical protein [Candidatus Dependentiae bacterium]MBU4386916.1 hypothetical protein [Candidatus Dependentiae bacterium]MCG2756393.1 hypothetical protein [Candidatus Dependentiae bacterium]